jgi:DNA-directed RNA polymerase
MLEALPIFEIYDDLLVLRADVSDFAGEVLWRIVKDNPLLAPCTTAPDPWTQVRKGGLPADHWAAGGSLVRGHRRSSETAMHKAIASGRMQPVLDAINTLQSERFTINVPILNFVKQHRHPRLGIEPPRWHTARYRQWLKDRAKINSFNLAIATAEPYAEDPWFYNASLTMDFRGRQYASQHFNFSREDHVRALFLFADAEPIGSEGIRWLKARVATLADGNAFSLVEKPSDLEFTKRIEWTEKNLDQIRAVADAVKRGDSPETVAYALPSEDDDRYQYAAACCELVNALDVWPDYRTRLPLMFDGSNNGLQHMCAMMRDEVGGRYVNLVPDRDPDDFYKRVAFQTYDSATDIMESPFDRGIVKQPAVSYFYGAGAGGFVRNKRNGKPYGRTRAVGMTGQIINYLKKKKKPTKGAVKLAHAVYGAIEDMLPRAKAARDFLQELAMICARHDKPLRCVTLLGLPVINDYHPPDVKTFSVWLGKNRRRRLNFTVGDKPGIDETKAANAAAANFVHSLDACHLQMVALTAAKEGIRLVAVHDCYGCHARHAKRLNEIILEQLVHLHRRYNLLNEVLQSAKRDLPKGVELPRLPELGTLELSPKRPMLSNRNYTNEYCL